MLPKDFASCGLDPRILRALAKLGHESPTSIQARAIVPAIAGQDILGCAQTGTGKTGSFALPILHRLCQQSRPGRGPRALILAPTRELAAQIGDAFREYSHFLPHMRVGLVIGGLGMGGQAAMLRRGVDVLIATPGRLKDHLERRNVGLRDVQCAVLDEADRMLDMGFVRDVRTIFSHVPRERQTLLFSATLPSSILALARELLNDPQRIEAQTQSTTPILVEQTVAFLHPADKRGALLAMLDAGEMTQTIVFARTKYGADKLARFLDDNGHHTAVLHGNKSQSQRQQALARFKRGQALILVATDIAARGIDVAGVSHVVNFELPQTPEDYVHRIGRTGRAQTKGEAISLVSPDERSMLRSIERLTGVRANVRQVEGFAAPEGPPAGSPSRRRPRRRWAA